MQEQKHLVERDPEFSVSVVQHRSLINAENSCRRIRTKNPVGSLAMIDVRAQASGTVNVLE